MNALDEIGDAAVSNFSAGVGLAIAVLLVLLIAAPFVLA